jgi:hypothetical protein
MSNLVKHQGFAPQTMTEAIDFSNMLSKSTMVPKAYQNKPEDVLVAVQWGYELGLAPLQALQNIATINGKPSVYGDAAMALVQNSPVCEDIQEYFEGEGTSNPIAVCVAKRKNRTEVISKYSVEDAKRAGLWNKQGPWTQYPKRMLQMRARGFALRDAFPDVLKGLITVEEAQDYPDDMPAAQAPQIKHANPLDAIVVSAAEPANVDVVMYGVENTAVTVEECLQNTTVEIVSDQIQPPGTFKLNIPGKPSELHDGMTAWMDRYNEMADKVARSRLDKDVKIQKIGEFNTLNADVLKMLTAVQQAGMAAHKQKRKLAIEG